MHPAGSQDNEYKTMDEEAIWHVSAISISFSFVLGRARDSVLEPVLGLSAIHLVCFCVAILLIVCEIAWLATQESETRPRAKVDR